MFGIIIIMAFGGLSLAFFLYALALYIKESRW